MWKRKHNRTAGFSLIEVVVGIAVMGLVTAPVCASLILSVRMNSHSQALMKARLQASGVVETLLAEGIDLELDEETGAPKESSNYTESEEGEGWKMKDPVAPQGVEVIVDVPDGGSDKPYYLVKVTSRVGVEGKEETVEITTHVRKEGG